MPLAFASVSHGTVAFGFFNIASDMLLLERHFFFSTRFCDALCRLARLPEDDAAAVDLSAYVIDDPQKVGDLMGAIHGVRHTGFIGALYRRFPFPADPADFRQDPGGAGTQPVVEALVREYGRPATLSLRLRVEPGGRQAAVGAYRFERGEFVRLVDYVWQGGYPRWKGGVRPAHVERMGAVLSESRPGLFRDLAPAGPGGR